MKTRMAFCGALVALFGSATVVAVGQTASGMVPANGASATFVFTTSVHTPKGKHSGSGTITVKHIKGRSITLTVKSDDGTTRTIPLVVGENGTVAPDPSAPAPTETSAPDAAARAFMSDVSLAAHVGIAARKNAHASSFGVPVTLSPIGDGTPVPASLTMKGAAAGETGEYAEYTGSVSGSTMTKLPPGGGLDPATLAKTIGVGTAAHFAFGPAGRIATAVGMHHRKQQEKKAAAGLVPDDVTLNVILRLANGQCHAIEGTQNDVVQIASKKVTIASTWSFTRSGP